MSTLQRALKEETLAPRHLHVLLGLRNLEGQAMSVKERERLDEARFRKGAWAQQRRMVRCTNTDCQALNSPNAKICWRCGEDLNEEGS